MKKAITLLVCLVACIVGYARTISISTEDGLQGIATDVNDRNINHNEDTIILTDDITLTGEWIPIGKSGKPFEGVFDGRNHTISNLRITNGGNYSALFGLLEGVVENVIVEGVIVSANNSEHISGVVGLAQKKGTLVRNCHFIGSITVIADNTTGMDLYVGGIVGELKCGASVCQCSTSGEIRTTGNVKCVGGIVGRSGPTGNNVLNDPECFIEKCINLSDCNGYSSVGGILGYARQHTTIRNCLNCGNIDGRRNENTFFGGIVGGYYKDIVIDSCLSAGLVVAKNGSPSAIVGKISETQFISTCQINDNYYDGFRTTLNTSGKGDAKRTDETIEDGLAAQLNGWIFTNGYPYPKDFTNVSVIAVAKSYALFSNSETYDDIHTNFTVSDFEGTAWSATDRGLTEINGSNVNILADGRDTLTVRCGSYYKNVIVDVNVPTPLPITLLRFTVTETDCGNLLEWATATERRNAGFSLMRSPDATDWEAFAWQPTLCGGNSTTTTDYSYMDADIRWDTTYYRFMQYDSIWSQSGTYYPEASEIIVAMRRGGKPELPSIMYDGGCILLVAGSTTTDAYAYDIAGRLIYDVRLKPYATARLVVRGNAIVEFLWVDDGELMRKAYKVGWRR